MKIDYNGKKFVGVSNSKTGEVGTSTIFEYFVEDGILTGKYNGGEIVHGQLLGKVHPDNSLEFLYHHVNQHRELKSGRCISIPEVLSDGSIRLYESWQWMGEKTDRGESIIEEIIE